MSNLIFNDADFPNREEELIDNIECSSKYYSRAAVKYLLADFLILSKKLNINAEIDSIVNNYSSKNKIEELLEIAEKKNEKELFDDILEILIQFNQHDSLIKLEVIGHLVSMAELIINKSLAEAKVDIIDINVLRELVKVIDNLNVQLSKNKKHNASELKKHKAKKHMDNIKDLDEKSKEISSLINKLREMKSKFIDLMLEQYEKEQGHYVEEMEILSGILKQHMDAEIDIHKRLMEEGDKIERLNSIVDKQDNLIKNRSEDMLVLRERQKILQENITNFVAKIKELEKRRSR